MTMTHLGVLLQPLGSKCKLYT